jgi:ATP-dependent exoDNAse (exonuclease V) beta subunit
VQVNFIREPALEDKQFFSGEETDGETESSRWGAIAMDQLPLTLEELQLKGAELKDIAILVRKNDEGQRIAAHLLHYKNSGKSKDGCRYDVVSNESLRIDGASSVNLLLGAMRYLLNPEDSIARAQLGYEFSRLHEPQRDLPDVFSVTNQAVFENNLPLEFTDAKPALKKLPLIELTETLIGIFGLGKRQGELIYLQAFQDLVLEFYNREKNDLGAFLEWWEDNRHKKSVQIAGEVNAAQILTIHKSKGLQFKYVIIPFCSWNLDHDAWQAPNLWVNSEKSPFTEAGYLPVKYAKLLEQTFFSANYQEEHTRSFLDNLNLLYVAFTRAEQGLIVTAPHPEIRGVKASVAGLLYNSITANDILKKTWDETEARWTSGEWKLSASTNKSSTDALSLREYSATQWRNKLVIRQSGTTYFEETSEIRERINYGIHMHAVLSRMKYADEIEATLEAIVFEGLITESDRPPLRAELNELLKISEVASWFGRDWTVLTEVPILVPGGNESRLDRLIVNDKRAIVIDFKTGEQKRNDNEQVVSYMEILRQMNFVDVRGFLLYLREKEVVEVKEGGKQKAMRKLKDKDQLGLGF